MSHSIRASIRRVSLVLSLIAAIIYVGQPPPVGASDAARAAPVGASPVIVLGFVGGYVKHDATVHSAVQVGARLKQDYPSGVYVEVLENHRAGQAYTEIVRHLDTDRDGTLSMEEKRNARVVLYGHSWGASEAITLARELGKQNIPVLLTVQVDSVAKLGENDKVIPANVAEAANFYQQNGLVHGESQIRAADPARTKILGNFHFDYKGSPLDCKEYPWYNRLFMKAHTQIECDPKVWNQVESLIKSKLPPQHQ